MMRAPLLSSVLLSLAGCAGAVAVPQGGPAPQAGTVLLGGKAYAATMRPGAEGGVMVAIQREGQPFGYSEGAEARRAADAACGARGVRSGLRDRFEAPGTWVYPEGCA